MKDAGSRAVFERVLQGPKAVIIEVGYVGYACTITWHRAEMPAELSGWPTFRAEEAHNA